jgi:small-conductance mechanosensitive channel
LAEFEDVYIPTGNPDYVTKRDKILAQLQAELNRKKQAEQQSEQSSREVRAKLDSARRNFAEAEAEFKEELGRLENRRRRKVGLLKGEVEALERKRKRGQTRKPGLLDRLLRRGKKRVVVDFAKEIESKTIQMRDASMSLEDQVRELKRQHAEHTSPLRAEVERLTSELGSKEGQAQVDDALEVRRTACAALAGLVEEAAAGSTTVLNSQDMSSELPR